jgi:hypothetical protein
MPKNLWASVATVMRQSVVTGALVAAGRSVAPSLTTELSSAMTIDGNFAAGAIDMLVD